MQGLKLGKYQHYKGSLVEVLGIVNYSETLEEMVIYNHPDPIKGFGADSTWVRPKKMFLENVIVEGKEVPRFKYLREA